MKNSVSRHDLWRSGAGAPTSTASAAPPPHAGQAGPPPPPPSSFRVRGAQNALIMPGALQRRRQAARPDVRCEVHLSREWRRLPWRSCSSGTRPLGPGCRSSAAVQRWRPNLPLRQIRGFVRGAGTAEERGRLASVSSQTAKRGSRTGGGAAVPPRGCMQWDCLSPTTVVGPYLLPPAATGVEKARVGGTAGESQMAAYVRHPHPKNRFLKSTTQRKRI